MPFDADAIAVVTDGLRRDSGSFAERLVSHGLIGDITSAAVAILFNYVLYRRRRRRKIWH